MLSKNTRIYLHYCVLDDELLIILCVCVCVCVIDVVILTQLFIGRVFWWYWFSYSPFFLRHEMCSLLHPIALFPVIFLLISTRLAHPEGLYSSSLDHLVMGQEKRGREGRKNTHTYTRTSIQDTHFHQEMPVLGPHAPIPHELKPCA